MKYLLIMMIVSGVLSAEEKTFTVNKKSFSDVYPAVWFSPSTMKITPIVEKSDTGPSKEFIIFIEPDDPEFAILKKNTNKNEQGFQYLGEGEEHYKNVNVPAKLKLDRQISRSKMREGKPVYLFVSKNRFYVIYVFESNRKESVLSFKIKELPKK